MNTKKIMAHLFSELQNKIESLTEADIKKIESGDFTISLKIIKNTTSNHDSKLLPEQDINDVLKNLKECKDRKLVIKCSRRNLKLGKS